MKILVVDDSRITRRLVMQALEKSGLRELELTEAENGQVALSRMQETPPDLIISDLNMPEMSGLDLLKAVRALKAPIQFGVVSSNLTETVRSELSSAGVDFLLLKPFRNAELVSQVEECVKRRAPPQAATKVFADRQRIVDWMAESIVQTAESALKTELRKDGEIESYSAHDVLCGASLTIEAGGETLSCGLFADEPTSRRLARVLLEAESEEAVGKSEILDALGEVLNMAISGLVSGMESIVSDASEKKPDLRAGLPKFLLGPDSLNYLRENESDVSRRVIGEGLDLKLFLFRPGTSA